MSGFYTIWKSFGRLVQCVRSLGPVVGWRYWKMGTLAEKNPAVVLEWAKRIEDHADESHTPAEAAAFREWAALLRKTHAQYVRRMSAVETVRTRT